MQNKPTPAWRTILAIVGLFAAFFAIYRVFIAYESIAGMWIYLIAACGLLVAYVIVNRGFSSAPTPDEDLPEEWDAPRIAEFRADEAKRRRAAKWIMMFFLPVALVLLFDMFELFFWDEYIAKLFVGLHLTGTN